MNNNQIKQLIDNYDSQFLIYPITYTRAIIDMETHNSLEKIIEARNSTVDTLTKDYLDSKQQLIAYYQEAQNVYTDFAQGYLEALKTKVNEFSKQAKDFDSSTTKLLKELQEKQDELNNTYLANKKQAEDYYNNLEAQKNELKAGFDKEYNRLEGAAAPDVYKAIAEREQGTASRIKQANEQEQTDLAAANQEMKDFISLQKAQASEEITQAIENTRNYLKTTLDQISDRDASEVHFSEETRAAFKKAIKAYLDLADLMQTNYLDKLDNIKATLSKIDNLPSTFEANLKELLAKEQELLQNYGAVSAQVNQLLLDAQATAAITHEAIDKMIEEGENG